MKGHPILGVISGFFFGLFLGATLFMFGFIPLHSPLLWILPLVGIVLGLLMAAWAPFGSGATAQPSAEAGIASAATVDADDSRTSGTTIEQDVVEPAGDDGDGDHDA